MREDLYRWRLVVPGEEPPVPFGTEDGVRLAAALRMEHNPRGPLPIVQYRNSTRDIWRNADPAIGRQPRSRYTVPTMRSDQP